MRVRLLGRSHSVAAGNACGLGISYVICGDALDILLMREIYADTRHTNDSLCKRECGGGRSF